MTTNNDKANWLIVGGSDYEPHGLDEAILVLGKTLEEVLPIGLLRAIDTYEDRVELVPFNADDNPNVRWVTIEARWAHHKPIKINRVSKTNEEIFAILDAHYGRDVWVHMLRGDGRSASIKRELLDDNETK